MADPADRLEAYRAALADFAEAERLFASAYTVAFGDENVGLPLNAKPNKAGLLVLNGSPIGLDDLMHKCVARAEAAIALCAPSLRAHRPAAAVRRGRRWA